MTFKTIVTALALLSCGATFAQNSGTETTQSKNDFNFVPEVHGLTRVRYEYATDEGESKFAVRSARLKLVGNINPYLGYHTQADFCVNGKFSMIYAFAWLKPIDKLKITLGQSRVPFSNEGSRSAEKYIFANRSFLGKYLGNYIGAGVKVGYDVSKALSFEGSIYSPATISDHNVYSDKLTYSLKGAVNVTNELTAEAGFMTLAPYGTRMNQWAASLMWKPGRWTLGTEYARRHYTHNFYNDCSTYFFMADYGMPLKSRIFNRMSFQGRYDGMDDYSAGEMDADGNAKTTLAKNQRITAGVTTSYICKQAHADLRLNYERYLNPSETTVGEKGKIVLELALVF